MESTNILRKIFTLFEKLRGHDSDKVSLLNELFERLLLLKNKYKITFDLESFLKTSLKDIETINFENDNKDSPVNSLKIKKISKNLFNSSLLHLFKLLQDEKHFEYALDILVDLMDSEFDMAVEVKGVKNVEFLELFLNTLFYGKFYYKGLVQHFLLNSKYTFHLPFTLNSIIKNMEKNRKFNEYLNNNNLIDRDTFYERFLIFISKLNTPDTYIPLETNQVKVLKIPKKELALKNPVGYLQNDNNREYIEIKENFDDPEEYDGNMSDFDDSEDDKDESYDVDIMFYGNNYIKLWDNILNDLLYTVNEKNLIIILESLPQLALPFLDNPIRIANFLYNNLKNDLEDIVINSLNCLFELILYHSLTDQIDLVSFNIINDNGSNTNSCIINNSISGIKKINNNTIITNSNTIGSSNNSNNNKDDNDNEFDWFYQKLYYLISFKYLSSKSNVVLILLIEKALNSSMLPNNLVSTFIKKLLSASTTLETNICNCLLIISLNLLQKHYHHLLFLIHSPSIDNKHGNDNNNITDLGALIGKDNIIKEGIESQTNLTPHEKLFLHELYLLLNHFNYDTVKIIGVFFTDLRLKNKISFNLRDFLYPENVEKIKDLESNPFKSTVQNSTTMTKSFFE